MFQLGRYIEAIALSIIYGLLKLRIEYMHIPMKDIVGVKGWMSMDIIGCRRAVLPPKNLGET